ncbi:MAG: histidine--tRNA ligase [Kiritimatiellaeota bacterium]|nr:histidine--tRNA ligase [Kiritimatiellota bacterium]
MFQPIPGMADLAAPEVLLWQRLEEQARRIMPLYGFTEIRTPALEYTPVFTRALGETTDVVQKEMYTLADRGGRSLTLRPEGTAGVIRYAAGQGAAADGARLYYVGPMFRCERPQAGRKRQFHQLGVEALGEPNPAADVEVIALQQHLFQSWGLRDFTIDVNTRGLPDDRPAVAQGLAAAVRPQLDALCADCRRRFDTNILRLLDCKQESCRQVIAALPDMATFMSAPARAYLDEVVRLLAQLHLPARVNPRLVRGLDYYIHTVWEIRHPALGAQDALSGGGRYRITQGEKNFDGVGFAAGLERAVMAVQHDQPGWLAAIQPDAPVSLVALGAAARDANLQLAQELRQRGCACGLDLGDRSLKAQMRAANRAGSAWAVIRGERELAAGAAALKDLRDGQQTELKLEDVVAKLIAATGPTRVAPAPG